MTVTEVELKIEEKQLDIEQMRLIGLPEEVIREQEEQVRIYQEMLTAIQTGRQLDLDSKVPSKLVKEVSSAFDITPERMFKKTRKREVVNARQVYIYLLRTTDVAGKRIIPFEKTKFARLDPRMGKRDRPNSLARHVGCDHATVLYSIETTFNHISTERDFRELVYGIQCKLLDGRIPMPDITIKAYKDEVHT